MGVETMFAVPNFVFWVVLVAILSFLAMTHFSSAQVPRDKKYDVAKNDKIVIKTIKKPKFIAQNIVSTPIYAVSNTVYICIEPM